MVTKQTLAEIAYDAYYDMIGRTNLLDSYIIPEYKDADFEIKEAWAKAAVAVVVEIHKHLKKMITEDFYII